MDHYEAIEHSLFHIEENLHEPLSLESVARASHMSKFYFHRLFSALMGCSLHHYIVARRLNASIPLIQVGDVSLTEIAYQLNFGTPSSFSRAFKQRYGMAPSSLRAGDKLLSPEPMPPMVRRSIKNMNGDIVTDFTLAPFEPIRLNGIAFEVDLATDAYKAKIRSYSELLVQEMRASEGGSCFVVYSNCEPDSTRFKVLVGTPLEKTIDHPYYFNVEVPKLFCAKFKYYGDLLDIGDVLKSDYARFLKISKLETEDSPVEFVQVFDDIRQMDAPYHIFAPIKKLPMEAELA